MTNEDPSDPADTLAPGTQLGRYQILRVMGRGGMGAVYEGIHRDLKKRVAIKTLHPAVAAMPGARARFLREGEAASRIRHPNVVDVTDVGTEGGVAYLVMEFLEGEDLASVIERVGALPIADAVDILLAVVGAIAVAHEEGVVHRDLKPGNIFMAKTRHGGANPTVLDFGISKLSSGGGNTLALTGTGAAMGTPYYVAPEQIRSAAGADGRSDQYALGAILYECVTGQRAHQGETIYDVIRSVGDGSFTPPHVHRPDIPPALEQAILRAMQLNPAQRFPSVQAFGRAILPFASPGARAQWAPALAGGAGADARTPPTLMAGPQAGGTVILPTPAPGAAPRTPAGRSQSAPKTNTTFGSSAGELVPRRPRRASLLAGGFVLLAGGAVAAYFVLAPTPRKTTAERSLPGAEGPAATSTAPTPKPPERYRVSMTVSPDSAHIDLDGRAIGQGKVDRELALDGSEHTLVVSAPGFQPARFVFRDRAPPGEATLERLAAAHEVVASPGAATGRQKSSPHAREHQHPHEGIHREPHAPAGGTGHASPQNGAPILD